LKVVRMAKKPDPRPDFMIDILVLKN
jgi:hypothetical protein